MASIVEELPGGVTVYQVTDEAALTTNIYCERSYCTPDSRLFVYVRKTGEGNLPHKFEAEYVACEFGTWNERVLGSGNSYPEISLQGNLFYEKTRADSVRELFRVNLMAGRTAPIPVEGGVRPYTGMTISPNEDAVAYGTPLSFDPQMFGVELVDLTTGRKRLLCEDPFICNPHPQFDLCEGHQILVQQNRGCEFDREGNQVRLVGEEGATLFTVDIHEGVRTPLLVGEPHTPRCTGHQQWVGRTREVALTIASPWSDGKKEGTLLGARPGERPRVLVELSGLSHVHASRCGRFFCCDVTPTREIIVGSIQTGRWLSVCHFGPEPENARERYGFYSWRFPYLSPDLRWLVFNSCRTGRPEIYVAAIPAGLFDCLEQDQ